MLSTPQPAPAQKAYEKPVKLELNNSGAWKTLGRFDAADDEHAGRVLDAAKRLVTVLHHDGPEKACPSLRVSMAGTGQVICHWDMATGWIDSASGEVFVP